MSTVRKNLFFCSDTRLVRIQLKIPYAIQYRYQKP